MLLLVLDVIFAGLLWPYAKKFWVRVGVSFAISTLYALVIHAITLYLSFGQIGGILFFYLNPVQEFHEAFFDLFFIVVLQHTFWLSALQWHFRCKDEVREIRQQGYLKDRQ